VAVAPAAAEPEPVQQLDAALGDVAETAPDEMAGTTKTTGTVELANVGAKTLRVAFSVASNIADQGLFAMLACVGNVMSKKSGRAIKAMKGADATRAVYLKEAKFGWMEEAFELLDVLKDPKALERMGVATTFASSQWRDVGRLSNDVQLENAKCAQILEWVLCVLEFFVVDGMQLADNYPGLLCRAAEHDDAARDDFMTMIRSDLEDEKEARKQPGKTVRQWQKHSEWEEPVMMVLEIVLEEADPEDACNFCHEYGVDITGLWGQAKINEEDNRLSRVFETKQKQSKTMSDCRRDAVPVGHNVCGAYDRDQVPIPQEDPDMPKKPPDDFYRVQAEHILTGKVPLRIVTNPRADWWSPNAQSQHVQGPEKANKKTLRGKADWSGAELSWMAGLLPEHKVVQRGQEEEPLLVLRVQDDTGVLFWPLVETDGGWFDWVRPRRLQWELIDDIERWHVLTSRGASPANMFAEKKIKADGAGGRITLHKYGSSRIPVLEYQDGRGYAKVKGSTLNSLLKHLRVQAELVGLATAEPDVEECASDDGKVMVVMLARNPNAAEEDLKDSLQVRHYVAQEDTDCFKRCQAEQVLNCLMLHQDALETTSWVTSTEKQQNQMRAAKSKISRRVVKFVERATPILGPRRNAPVVRQPRSARSPQPDGGFTGNAWKASLKARDSEMMRRLKPVAATIWKNNWHGYWNLMYQGQKCYPGYASWTKSGHGEAARSILEQAWKEEFDRSGISMPDDIREAIDAIPP
jgi:hypothetical protein